MIVPAIACDLIPLATLKNYPKQSFSIIDFIYDHLLTSYWNSYEIRVQGNEIEVKLNNQLVSAGTFPKLLEFAAPSDGKKKRSEGFIGLQCHTEVVQFRNIRIKEL